MEQHVRRGHKLLLVVFVLMGLTYFVERSVYHAVIGLDSILQSLIITALLVGMGFLIYRGDGWVRWVLGVYVILNGLGTPRGMADVFGPTLSFMLAVTLLVAHVGCALTVCLSPRIAAFLRYQRTQRQARKQLPIPPDNEQ